jgi:predicted nucleotidyltransferase
MILEDDIQQYVGELMAAYSEIESVWLFGSRANGTNRPESDWDLLAFGSREMHRRCVLIESFITSASTWSSSMMGTNSKNHGVRRRAAV